MLAPVDNPAALAQAIIVEIQNGTKHTRGVFAAQYAQEGYSWENP